MIRRWSYIKHLSDKNLSYLDRVDESIYNSVCSKHSFKTFRKTTKFKKYNLGITKSVRKAFTNRKFSSSYYNLNNLGVFWVKSYLTLRNSYKNNQLLSLSGLTISSLSPNQKFSLLQLGIPGLYYNIRSKSLLLSEQSSNTFNIISKSKWYYRILDGSTNFYLTNNAFTSYAKQLRSNQHNTLLKYSLNLSLCIRKSLTLLILKHI